ncbi:MAG: CDGSH iron-sulfur domain-containing protein [Xanthobacteraceae bacterium]|nr:CDGSH iron-sulfur domain-containing protein [Xanthobacteraceae bacterium]
MERKKSQARVAVSKNGPYIVTGGVPLSKQTIAADANGDSTAWTESGNFFQAEKYALCRCGHSKNKPFCDGTHARIGFDGTETASREPYIDQTTAIDGPALMLTDVESLCAFARFCDPNGKVWAQVAATDDPAVRAMFLRQVNDCPSGRLVAWDKATGAPVERELPVSIGLIEDPQENCSGPIWLRGGMTLVTADGFTYETRNRVTLCRCGESRNKPFCDGTHASIKFHA